MYKEWNQAGGKLSKGGFDFLPSMFYFCDPQSLPASSEEILHAAMGSSPLCNPQYLSLKRVSLVFYNMYHQPLQFNRTAIWTEYTYNSQPLLTPIIRGTIWEVAVKLPLMWEAFTLLDAQPPTCPFVNVLDLYFILWYISDFRMEFVWSSFRKALSFVAWQTCFHMWKSHVSLYSHLLLWFSAQCSSVGQMCRCRVWMLECSDGVSVLRLLTGQSDPLGSSAPNHTLLYPTIHYHTQPYSVRLPQCGNDTICVKSHNTCINSTRCVALLTKLSYDHTSNLSQPSQPLVV